MNAQIVLYVFGFLSAFTGVFFIYKKIGDGENDIEVKPFGKIKTRSSGIVFFMVGSGCVIAGTQIPTARIVKQPVVEPFNYIRTIRDENGNPANRAFAFIILNNETLYSNPPFTGDDGRFNILVDTSEGAILPFYYGKSGYDTSLINNNISSVGGTESFALKKKLPPVDENTFFISGIGISNEFIQLIERETDLHYLRQAAKNKIVIDYDRSRFEADPDDPQKCRYNKGGKVIISVNGSSCLTINREVDATLSIYQAKNKVQAKVSENVKEIVAGNHILIARKIKECLL